MCIDQKRNFTLEHTKIAKGIAILLMVYVHLFAIPERMDNDYYLVLNIFGTGVQQHIAIFTRVCVCIYVFLSGLGLYYSLIKFDSIISMYKKVFKHALKFMINYWIIAFFVYTIGFCFFDIVFDFWDIYKVIFGISDFVSEWWYVPMYMVMLFYAPIFTCIFKTGNIFLRFLPAVLFSIIFVLLKLIIKFNIISFGNVILTYISYMDNYPIVLTFFVGFICAHFNLYRFFIYNSKLKSYIVSFVSLCISISIRMIFANDILSLNYDFIVAPLFTFSVVSIISNFKISIIFKYFSKHSTNIWLIHTVWCYYFAKSIVLLPYYSPLVYLWLLFLSLLSSYFINLLYIPLINKFFSQSHKLSYKGYLFKERQK